MHGRSDSTPNPICSSPVEGPRGDVMPLGCGEDVIDLGSLDVEEIRSNSQKVGVAVDVGIPARCLFTGVPVVG